MKEGKPTCDEGAGDWRWSCWRERSAVVCLWSEVRAFDGPHIEAMVISGVERGQTNSGCEGRDEKRRGCFMVGKVVIVGGDEPGS